MIRFPPGTKLRHLQQVNLDFVTQEWAQPSRARTFEYLKTEGVTHIVDIGANVGVFTKLCLQKLPEVIEIMAFEPDLDNFEILCYNFEDESRVLRYPIGIFYGKNKGKLRGTGDGNPGGGIFEEVSNEHLHPHVNKLVSRNVEVEMTTLENYHNVGPDLMKLDVEGSEYNIIENSAVLHQTRFLIIEFHGHDEAYLKDYIFRNLPGFTLHELTYEGYGTGHHMYSFLEAV
jgi:FkbM family methyltransferase